MKKLLVVIDYQNDFVNGALGFAGAELLDERIAAKVKAYHKEKDAHRPLHPRHRGLGCVRQDRRGLRCP